MSLDDHSLYEPFRSQFRDNRGYYFSAQLNIPIFGGLSRRTRTNRARNNWRIAEQQRDQTLRALQSEIAQNYQQMLGYGKEFVQASKKARPPSWPTTPSPASTTGAWFRRSTFRPPPTTCCRPAPNGCAHGCNTLSKRAWSSITTVRP